MPKLAQQAALAKGLARCGCLRQLDIRCNRLGPGAARPLGRQLGCLLELEHLELGSNGLREIGCSQFFLAMLPPLVVEGVEDEVGWEAAVGCVGAQQPEIRLGGDSGIEGRIRGLDELGGKGAAGEGAAGVSCNLVEPLSRTALGAQGKWRYLGLRNNFIGDIGVQALASQPGVRTLQRLDLSGESHITTYIHCNMT